MFDFAVAAFAAEHEFELVAVEVAGAGLDDEAVLAVSALVGGSSAPVAEFAGAAGAELERPASVAGFAAAGVALRRLAAQLVILAAVVEPAGAAEGAIAVVADGAAAVVSGYRVVGQTAVAGDIAAAVQFGPIRVALQHHCRLGRRLAVKLS